MNKFFKRLALLLAVLMIVSMMPVQLFADNSVAGEEQSNGTGEASGNSNAVAKIGDTGYESLADAIANATPDANGVITYEISGKATVDSTGWIQVARAGLTGLTKVEFVGKTSDAEICITGGLAILADQNYDIDVSFESLTLSKPNPEYGGDYGHSTNYFTTWLRNTNAAENTVTYTNCTFPNGACNNQYGKTVVDGCAFSNTTTGMYNFWNYGGNTEIKNSKFTGVRGIKIYSEKTHGGEVLVSNTTFDGLTEKAAIVASKATDITLDNVSATDCGKGFFQKDIEGSSKDEKITITANGSAISGTFNITADKTTAAAKEEFNISAGTFTSEVSSDYLADGFELKDNGNGTYGVKEGKYVAQIGDVKYETLAEAIAAAKKNSTVKLLADTRENVTIDKALTLDLNGFTLNGGTEKGKPALTITARIVTIKDSSEAQTGTIMREDTEENSGVSSHYVIDIQGNAWVMFESGKVMNNSGTTEGKGASLVRVGDDSVAKQPGLVINGGSFTQDNFIVIKVDRGYLTLNGGTLNSANSYAIENWFRATIKGGTVNGAVSSWTYSSGSNSTLTISGGTINGDVTAVNYGSAEGKVAKVEITGGTVNGELDTRNYDPKTSELSSIDDVAKATIGITGGTFSSDPTKYLVAGSTVTPNSDGTFGVAKAYLAKVGDTSYYTMEEAFKAQTASGEPIVLLRDYTTGSTFNSGTVARVVDLNGHTWTCTGKDANSAAFEINNANASLTVKNGKIVSSQLVGLIPSAMGGTIKYDNSSLTFENVQMSTTATSGIETNGNNTNDTVTLKNSTLNVPNGFGIYFPSSGTLTLDNSTVNAKTMGVQVCAGSLSINEGSAVTVTGDAVPKTENDGAIQDGAAISIVNRIGYKGLGTVTVSGGTFTAKKGNSAIKAYNWENNTESKFTAREKVAVSGGTFSSEVSEDLCAEGFIPTKNADDTYGVKAGKYVAQIGSTKYETLEEAVAAANDGDTVTLLADVTADVAINNNITLDLGGKTLTNTNSGKATITISAGTTATVKNGNVIGGASYYNIGVGTEVNSTANLTLEDVTATAGNTDSSMIDNWGTLTITSGTYTGGLNVVKSEEGSTLTINGGKFELNYAVNNKYNGVILSAGTTMITGGEFIQNATTPRWGHPQVVLAMQVDGYISKIEITGGTFTNNKSGESIFHGSGKANSSNFEVSGGTFNKSVSQSYFTKGYECVKKADGTYGVQEAMKGSKNYPYTLAELSVMTRDEYIAAQETLRGTMYVEIGDYSYDKNGVLGNGKRDDTLHQTEDRSVLNGYNSNGYLGEKNDGANGKNIIFVGGSVTSGVTGYASIDNIGTSLLLAVPAYTNVTFEGTTFNNVMSFDYQLYTGPWSQLGELKFSGCTFNGIIVGAIAAQTLTFDGCEFTNYTNTTAANSSNPTWIRPAYGNWKQGDNEGQGSDFRSLTTINFTGNTVTSTRPVKFEFISQWDITSTVTATGNYFDIKAQDGDKVIKNVGLYLGAHTDANKFHLVAANNTKSDNTAALYTIPEHKTSLPVDSTVKNPAGESIELTDALKWKATDAKKDKIVLKTVIAVASIGETRFATLEEAFAAAKNGDTITLLSNVEMTEIIRVTDGKKITLALNGFDVTITAKSVFIRVCNAELTITGKGTIKEKNPYFAPIIIKGGAEGSENYSVVNIKEGVTLEGWAGVMIDQTSETANNYGMVLNVEGATLNGVNDTDGANGSGIYVNGVVKDAKITLTNTTVTGTGTGMYLAGNADTTINGGSVKGDATGIEIRAGKLTLNNCDVTGGNGEVTATANGNGTTVTNAALAISQHTTKKPIEVIINGGTFNGTAAVYQTDVQGTGSVDVKIAVKSGTFNGTISGETDGAIVISGGKFKDKVDDKYFADKLACSATPNADGYYTVAAHPITKVGLTLGEDISIRIGVDAKYKDGKIKVTYETYDPNTKGMVTKEIILDKYELAGTNKYQFRISNITPQMADVVFTLQYLDSEDNEIGSTKQTSIIKYCEGLVETSSFEAYKAKVGQLLNYCATAMDFRAVSHADYLYNGLSWAERATALRAKISEYGYTVADIDFKTVGKYINRTSETIITGFGIEFAESVKLYYFIPLDNYKDGYTYVADGLMTPVPVYEGGKLTGYRVYLTVAMDGYHTTRTLYVYDANGNEVQRIGMAPDFALKSLYSSDKQTNEFKQLCKAAYQYFVAFAE